MIAPGATRVAESSVIGGLYTVIHAELAFGEAVWQQTGGNQFGAVHWVVSALVEEYLEVFVLGLQLDKEV